MFVVIDEYWKKGPGYFQDGAIVAEVSRRMNLANDVDAQRSLLQMWHDLYRQGHLCPGYDLGNPKLPFIHITTSGAKVIEHYGRDPANPAGYLGYLATRASLDPVAESYVREALSTYNSTCYKAAAVMIGAAAERVILVLRDAIEAKLTALRRPVPVNLVDWRAARILRAIDDELSKHRAAMGHELWSAFQAYWPAFVQQIRVARNDAGHPASIDPVTAGTVHGALLIFPEVAHLGEALTKWVASEMP